LKNISALIIFLLPATLLAQQKATVYIDAKKPGAFVSPELHGVFFEEISHAGEGGIYAELIQNRGFEEANIPLGMKLEGDMIIPPATPHFTLPNNQVSDWKMEWPVKSEWPAWSYKTKGNAEMSIARVSDKPIEQCFTPFIGNKYF
jgi:hypothetical protein